MAAVFKRSPLVDDEISVAATGPRIRSAGWSLRNLLDERMTESSQFAPFNPLFS
jgi:hypothetical protein